MLQQNLVGLYPTRSLAGDVLSGLRTQGIAESDISISTDHGGMAPQETTQAQKQRERVLGLAVRQQGFSGRARALFRAFAQRDVAVFVRVRSAAEHENVIDVMKQFNPIDIEAG